MAKFSIPFRKKEEPPSRETHLQDEEFMEMSFWDHLKELRDRVIKSAVALMIGTVIGFFFAGAVLDFLRGPYCQITELPQDCRLVILGPTGSIVSYFRVALLIGGVLAIPMITYQVMAFVIPGLTRRERRVVLMSLPAITLLFLVGVVFAWKVLVPPALGFLEGFQPDLFKPEWTADLYLSFVTALIFWMGVAFETPLVFFTLSLLGLVTSRLLIQNWRIAVIGSAIAAAIITPTVDPVNMFLVIAPLLVLYLISIVLVMIGQRRSGLKDKPTT